MDTTSSRTETIVLGGLITSKKGDSVSGIPLLSSIPYLGKLFSTTTTNNDRAELLVFLQPSIVKNQGALDAVQTDMDGRYKVSGDLRHFADGPGVLPPPNAVKPVSDKASAPKARPVAEPTPAPSKVKKSIRPSQL